MTPSFSANIVSPYDTSFLKGYFYKKIRKGGGHRGNLGSPIKKLKFFKRIN